MSSFLNNCNKKVMSKINYEGDLTGLSEHQLEFVSGVLKERGFKDETVTVAAVGKAGDNYVANVKRFIVEKDGDIFKMVAKVAPTSVILRTQMNTSQIFQNEHFMYAEVLPKFTELEEDASVPEKERLRYATCYGSLTEEPNEVILLEDLQISDFVMLDRMTSLKDGSVKLVLKNFAMLHSLSYALKNQEPETYKSFSSKLFNLWTKFQEIEEMKLFFEQLENDVIAILDNNEHKNIVNGLLTQLLNAVAENHKIDKDSNYSIIQQGDAWTNNILFRLKDNKPVECCMIDYQLSNHNTPVSDLLYMIFNCTDYETRAKHYHDWIDYYHSELDRCLINFQLKANDVYPRDQLDADLKRLGKVYFGLTIMVATATLKETEEAAKLKAVMSSDSTIDELVDASRLVHMGEATLARFKAKVEGLVQSFKELEYL